MIPNANKNVCDTQANPDNTLVHISCFGFLLSVTRNFSHTNLMQFETGGRQHRGIREGKPEEKKSREESTFSISRVYTREAECMFYTHSLRAFSLCDFSKVLNTRSPSLNSVPFFAFFDSNTISGCWIGLWSRDWKSDMEAWPRMPSYCWWYQSWNRILEDFVWIGGKRLQQKRLSNSQLWEVFSPPIQEFR